MIRRVLLACLAVLFLCGAALAHFGVTNLSGFGTSEPVPSKSFLGTDSDAVNKTNWSFTSFPLGAAHSRRAIVVAANSNQTVSAVTIAGVTSTQLINITTSGSASLWIALVPTGTSGTIDVTTSVSAGQVGIAGWRVINLRSLAAQDTDDDAAGNTSASLTLNVPANGVVITNTRLLIASTHYRLSVGDTQLVEGDASYSVSGLVSSGQWDWTGVTERADVVVESSAGGANQSTVGVVLR